MGNKVSADDIKKIDNINDLRKIMKNKRSNNIVLINTLLSKDSKINGKELLSAIEYLLERGHDFSKFAIHNICSGRTKIKGRQIVEVLALFVRYNVNIDLPNSMGHRPLTLLEYRLADMTNEEYYAARQIFLDKNIKSNDEYVMFRK